MVLPLSVSLGVCGPAVVPGGPSAHRATPQCQLDLVEVDDGTPALADEALVRHVEVEEVQRVVDRLHLAHLHEPHLDVLGGSDEHAMTVVLGLAQHLRREDGRGGEG